MSKLICVDAGHGGTDSGASGNGIIEKVVTLRVANILGELLKNQGFNVIFTRTADNFVSLGERCRIANSKEADLFVSIHVNSASNKEARGTETLCYSKNKLAEAVQLNLVNDLKTKDRGIKERKDLYVLNGTKMTAVLVEMAFLSNKEDAELIKGKAFLYTTALAVTKGICQYFNIKFKADEEVKPNSKTVIDKDIDILLNGERIISKGYFADNKNLFTADFLRTLGFDVGYNPNTKQVIINSK